MGLYEGIKDVAKVVQQADNLELYRRLLDLSAQALDLQDEIANLKRENVGLREELSKKKKVIRHKGIYITFEGDVLETPYCASCFGRDDKLIQLFAYSEKYYRCPVCKICAEKLK